MVANWGQAKIQILALKPEIEAALEAGKTVGAIYEDLFANHRITMSSVTFYRWCRRFSSTADKQPSQPFPFTSKTPADPSDRQASISRVPAPSFQTSTNNSAARLAGQLAPEDEKADDLM